MAKVLVVEDNFYYRNAVVESLRAAIPTLQVEGAADGKEAFEKIEALHLEIIFMDIRLPDGSGLDFAPKIKARFPFTHIVILTVYDLPEYRQRASELGINCFLLKDEATVEKMIELIENYTKC